MLKRTLCGLLAAFLLSAMSTIDRHDEHLNAKVVAQYQNKAEASQQYVDAAYDAMVKRNDGGDYGEVYEP